ncbi:MAG: phosphoribosylanthranilate isomerase [Maribacter sp.]|nr:phosphoribosylanthranilate isomerase [Maribacter sp.]
MSHYHKNTDTSIRETLKLKVCGMNQNTAEVGALKPDYLGFIFWKPSKRNFDKNPMVLPHSIKKVGVFVDEKIAEIVQKVKVHQLLAVQLHGSESPVYCSALKLQLKGTKIIKAFSIKDKFNFKEIKPYESVCDFYLFDTKGKLPGGNGFKFDWEVLKGYPFKKPFFLSGGIGLEDLDAIKEFIKRPESKYCHAIDVNSKFEIAPGLKDIEKLKDFIKDLK